MVRASAILLALALGGCGGTSRAPAPVEGDAAVVDSHKPDTRPDLAIDVFDAPDGSDVPGETADATDDTLLADASDTAPACDPTKTCVGAPSPAWVLEDFQPKSSGFKKTYGLSAFKPKVTVVALLAGW